MFVGWDWASTTHDVTVVDDAGRILDRWAAEHTKTGLDQTMARLAGHGRPEQLPVAIERPSGLVVDRLLAAGHPVIPIHPNAFHATRPRWGAAGAKSDPGDSFKLADYLRTDGHRLRRLRPLDAATRQLQALARVRDDHVAAKTAASNQLGALLDAHWPGPSRSSPGSAPRSPWRSWTPIRPRSRQPGSARPAWPPSAGDTPTAVAAARPSSSSGSAPPPQPRSGSPQRCSPS
jgi:hypothetical protein